MQVIVHFEHVIEKKKYDTNKIDRYRLVSYAYRQTQDAHKCR